MGMNDSMVLGLFAQSLPCAPFFENFSLHVPCSCHGHCPCYVTSKHSIQEGGRRESSFGTCTRKRKEKEKETNVQANGWPFRVFPCVVTDAATVRYINDTFGSLVCLVPARA